MYVAVRKFWSRLRLEVMQRGGIGWEDLAGMEVEQFFYILHVTEKTGDKDTSKPKK